VTNSGRAYSLRGRLAALAVGVQLFPCATMAYEATADVTFSWATDGLARSWTSSAPNSFTAPPANAELNTTFFSALSGSNATNYYNSDFAKPTDATGWCPPGTEEFQAQYACKVGQPSPLPFLVPGSLGPGASATGVVSVTDTTMTGTLTVVSTTDEGAGPQPGTTAATGYNVRSADGSPFKNVWYGVSSVATLTVNLTGTFTATDWDITGGTATIADPAFQCAVADFSGVLCASSTVGGGFQPDGSALSWGMDQGGGAGTPVGPIKVYSEAGGSQSQLIATLSGVLASLTIDGSGNIATGQGEVRLASGSNGAGCPQGIRYDGNGITCGTLQVARLEITGTAQLAAEAPDPFSFASQTGVALSTAVTSNTVTISGLTNPATVAVTGGEYSIGCTTQFTALTGTISNGESVCVRQTSAGIGGVTTTTALRVGGGSGSFAVTTIAPDTTPDPFTFVDVVDASPNSAVQSQAVTIQGLGAPAPLSIVGGAYSIGCTGVFTSGPTTITDGQTVCLRVTASFQILSTVGATLTIGGVSDTFAVTTGDDAPDAFDFESAFDADPEELVESNTVTITGLTIPTPISAFGLEYAIDGSAYTAQPGTLANGQQLRVRLRSSRFVGGFASGSVRLGSTFNERFASFQLFTRSFAAADDAGVTGFGQGVEIPILANDQGFDLQVADVQVFRAPLRGTVAIVGSGAARVARYTPAPGFVGTDTFEYGVDDGARVDIAVVSVRVIDDPDGDQVSSEVDNCTEWPNPGQGDADGDGFGNACDADLNQDGRVNFADVALFRGRFGTSDPAADFDGSGLVNFADLARLRVLFGRPPGPSGLAR
jgi:hypothetical protein